MKTNVFPTEHSNNSEVFFLEKLTCVTLLSKLPAFCTFLVFSQSLSRLEAYSSDDVVARFFTFSDEKQVLFDNKWKLPKAWWSRHYEYIWASKFASQNDICLDAACGIEHPFKYFLAEKCKTVYACDADSIILNKATVIKKTVENFLDGPNQISWVQKLYEKINFSCINLTRLPYADRFFDKIYCISVLEHLTSDDVRLILCEFNRTLKDSGIVILTFDYPTINLSLLCQSIKASGFKMFGRVLLEKPVNAVYSSIYKLYVFRAVLAKE